MEGLHAPMHGCMPSVTAPGARIRPAAQTRLIKSHCINVKSSQAACSKSVLELWKVGTEVERTLSKSGAGAAWTDAGGEKEEKGNIRRSEDVSFSSG